METKKKLNLFFFKFGAVSKAVILLMLVLGLQLILSTTCFASVSKDYIQFTLDSIASDTSLVLSTSQLNAINSYRNNSSKVQDITDTINAYLSLYNYNLNDYNTIVFCYYSNTSSIDIYFTCTNCSAASSSIGFLDIQNYSNNAIKRLYKKNGSALTTKLSLPSENINIDTSMNGIYVWCKNGYISNSENTVINLSNCYNYSPTQSIYFTPLNRYVMINNGDFTYTNTLVPPEPEEPSGEISGDTGSTGTITNPSGEVTGNVDLSGIENSLGNIENKIPTSGDIGNILSGETGKIIGTLTDNPDLSNTTITSGEISNALGFDFAQDPYSNFWLELTTGLSGALTNNVRSIDIQFRGETYTISLDNFAIQVPQFLKSFLAILSTVFIFWKMVKYWKIIIDNITSGNMDEVLEMNEEERNY